MRRAAAALGWAAAAFVAGCEEPRTELVVRVDSEVPWGVGQTVQSVVLTVRRGGATGALRSARTTVLGEGGERRALPLFVGVIAGDDVETPVWIEALGCPAPTGCSTASAVVVQRAVVRFARGETLEVPMLLASACVGASCALDEQCGSTGRCEPATRAQERLGPFEGADGTGPMDAGFDAGVEAGTGDAGTFDVMTRPDDEPGVDARSDPDEAPLDRPAADHGADTCSDGTTRLCYSGPPSTRGVGPCIGGLQRCGGGRFEEECDGETRPQGEECNSIDDDCDGVVDNIVSAPCYTGPSMTRDVGICHSGVLRCSGVGAPLCAGQVVPETREVCGNGRDDNCNGTADEGECAAAGCDNPGRLRWNIPAGTVGGPGCVSTGGGFCEGTAYCSGGACTTTPPSGCGGDPFCGTLRCNDGTYQRDRYCSVRATCNGSEVIPTGFSW
ncbi:MAG: MopE-related protein [Deltaproteobacteria bacterium]|nr:MopE-related protein [Myxococcales bacterium]MDP3219677.1 MopE-related protein [Deltaproteobacteria bacterium]